MSSSINASMASDTAAPATPAPPETLCASQVESNDCVRYAACTWNGAACSVSTPEEEEDGDDGSVLYIIIIVVLSLGCLMMLGLLVYCTKQSEKQKEKDRKLYEKEQELLKRADQQMQDEMKNLEHAHVALEAKDKEATALREEVSQRNNYIAEQAEIMQTNNRVKWEAEEALRNYTVKWTLIGRPEQAEDSEVSGV
ncbi:hypothetical protein DIPPA_01151 [Diplonema papillatum]|nr:hypothetical protein DIPPA_01151 [Diplonema papillatum]